MGTGKRYSQEAKAQVLAALLSGQGVSDVARRYKVSKATVSRIKSSLSSEQLQQIGSKRADEFSELLARYLQSILEANSFIMEFIQGKRESKWLEKQSAAEIGTLSGINADKAIRLFEGIEAAAEQPADMEAPAGTPDESLPE